MIQQAKAKIFLADQRGLNETNRYQTRSTFNFGNYFNEHKDGFGNIYLLNDDLLAGSASMTMQVKQYSHILLLPIAGAINYKNAAGETTVIAAGQAYFSMADKGDHIEISNPFSEDTVNFLQVWIKAVKITAPPPPQLATYDNVNEQIDKLVSAVPVASGQSHLPFTVSIGKFNGRGETVYLPKNKKAGIFAFVIEGAFELEGRLLHARDGLALWETGAIEMEALSNGAIVLVLELS